MATALVNSYQARGIMPVGARAVGGSNMPAGCKPAGPGVDYVGHTRCRANNDTCQGPRAKGTDYCVGHLKQMERQGESVDAAE